MKVNIRSSCFFASLFLLFLSTSVHAQCLTSGDVGDFEHTNLTDEWFTGDQGNGTISQETTTIYSGTKSTKIEVTTPSTWQVRLYNKSCTFNITNGASYRAIIYAKGTIGNSFEVSLLNNTATESTQNIELTSNDWKKYEVVLTSATTSAQGRIRLNFKDVGTYYIDNIYYESINLVTASVTDPNLCWEGVATSEITSGNEVRVFRFLKNYATTNLPTYYTAERASSSAGITLSLKTSSPTVNMSFAEDLTWAGDIYNHKISVLKNGVYQFNTNDFDIALSNSTGSSVEWKFIMPTYTQMNLKGIELESGHALESMDCNNKPTYIAIGNSITMGVGLTENDSRESYSRIIADSLGYELYNWGIGGSKVHDSVYSNLENSSLNPDLVTILWGYNDVHYSTDDSHFANSTFPKYESLLTKILQNYPSTCVMAILPTFTSNPTNTTERSISKLEAGQLSIIQNLQGTYPNLDYMQGSAYTDALGLNDAVHLNNQGNRALAEGVVSELSCGVITSHEEQFIETGSFAYPNPTLGMLFLKKEQAYTLTNLSGQVILKSFGKSLDLNQLQNGIYLLRTVYSVQKIVKH